jgi:hypothetical protein
MALKTCIVTKQRDGRWQVKCTKCPYKQFRSTWHAAATLGWRHKH